MHEYVGTTFLREMGAEPGLRARVTARGGAIFTESGSCHTSASRSRKRARGAYLDGDGEYAGSVARARARGSVAVAENFFQAPAPVELC